MRPRSWPPARPHRGPPGGWPTIVVALLLVTALAACSVSDEPEPGPAGGGARSPWHTSIPVTTFWVGEVLDPQASDGSQRISTYDSRWLTSYGGCDGVVTQAGSCETEQRHPEDGWWPTQMMPRENPFYLDLPYDDVNDPTGFARRCEVVPWADEVGHPRCTDRDHSYLKNRWVEVRGPSGRTCFGQVQDAGPAVYDDARYVFGEDDARPASPEYAGAGMDVSPALNGCLGLSELDGEGDLVDWRFVEAGAVPEGPWRELVTTSPVRR